MFLFEIIGIAEAGIAEAGIAEAEDSRQECCLVTVLRRQLERIFTFKT